MKKKLVAMILCTSVIFAVTACSGTEKTSQTETKATEAVTETAATELETESETQTETQTETETSSETTVETEAAKKPDSGTLSDDVYSFQVQIDEDVYQFPMTYAEFTAYGWVSKEDDTEVLDSNYRVSTWVFEKGDLQCYGEIVNFDINGRPLNECYVGGIDIDSYMMKDTGAKVILPGGIEIGKASAEDVKAAYGTPTYENTTDGGMTFIRYEKDSYQEVETVFDSETKLLDSIQIQNLVQPDDFEAGEVSDEVPEIVSKYQAPAAISDDMAAFTFSLADVVYQLPVPVSILVENGWSIVDDEELTVAGRDFEIISLMRDNQQMRVGVQNYSEGATNVANCFLVSVESDTTPITIGKGITLGMKLEDVGKALEGMTLEKAEGSSYTYFDVQPTDRLTDGYEIYISKETNEIYKIGIDYQPKYDDFTNQ